MYSNDYSGQMTESGSQSGGDYTCVLGNHDNRNSDID
jgi:hypothetical protein